MMEQKLRSPGLRGRHPAKLVGTDQRLVTSCCSSIGEKHAGFLGWGRDHPLHYVNWQLQCHEAKNELDKIGVNLLVVLKTQITSPQVHLVPAPHERKY